MIQRSGLFLGLMLTVITALFFTVSEYAVAQEGEPIPISSIEELQMIGNDPAYPLDGDYVLTEHIDASATATWNDGVGFEPIGQEWDNPFSGTFEGQGHIITGLTINRPEEYCVGLFGYLGKSSVIQNLGIEAVDVTANACVGGLAGNNEGTIIACYTTGVATGVHEVGGLIGSNSGSITTCYSTCVVMGGWRVGGLVSRAGGEVIACYAAGAVTGEHEVGGLVGLGWSAATLCYWDIETSGQSASPGGCGLTTAQMQTVSYFSNGGWSNYGWVMLQGNYPRLSWEGLGWPAIPEADIPFTGGGTESNPYLISTTDEFAMLSWYAAILGAHIQLTSDLDLSGVSLYPIGNLGTFSGVFDGDNHVLHNVFIQQPDSDHVGLFSYVDESGVIQNLGIESINITGNSYIGGLVGYNRGNIKECYVTGTITGGKDEVGGLLGCNYGTVHHEALPPP